MELLVGLDIVRFVGFFWVFLHHLDVPIQAIRGNGWVGMDLLFTLSSFLITSGFLNKLDIKKFYIKRILRIWPLYFLYLIVIGHWNETGAYFLFGGNWWVMFKGWSNTTLVGHLWAISMQEQFLLVWPWVFKKAGNVKNLSIICVLGLIVSFVLRIMLFGMPNYHFVYMNTFARLDPFLIGALVAIYKDKLFNWLNWPIIIAGITALTFIEIRQSSNLWMVAFGYLFIAIWAGAVVAAFTKIKSKAFTFLASLGYGLYVWHKLAIEIAWKPTSNLYLHGLLAFALSILIAYISYNIYEKNFRYRSGNGNDRVGNN